MRSPRHLADYTEGGMSDRAALRLLRRFTVDPKVCGGKPCIRNMRIRVSDVLDLLAHRLKPELVVQELPNLELDDVRAAILYASRRVGRPVLTA
jgi:uncharacterized protein (DUF433 family)